jgi:beta-glucoside operon transcriptional antiterminator
MRAIKKINNNVAICIDGNGNQLVAFGRGIGFPPMPYELTDLKQVERTFYDISGNYVDMINDIPEDVIRFTARMLDSARAILPYELMPNLILTLADHIAFCLERHRKGIYVRMPLVYEISQTYPLEMRIAQYILREMEKEFGVKVNPREASGIALSILNARVDAKGLDAENSELNQKHFDYIQEEITRMIEHEFRFTVDRTSFGFARFSTHLQHLCERLVSGGELSTENTRMYRMLQKEYPQIDECAEKVRLFLQKELQCNVSDEEKLYLILHINRINAKQEG